MEEAKKTIPGPENCPVVCAEEIHCFFSQLVMDVSMKVTALQILSR